MPFAHVFVPFLRWVLPIAGSMSQLRRYYGLVRGSSIVRVAPVVPRFPLPAIHLAGTNERPRFLAILLEHMPSARDPGGPLSASLIGACGIAFHHLDDVGFHHYREVSGLNPDGLCSRCLRFRRDRPSSKTRYALACYGLGAEGLSPSGTECPVSCNVPVVFLLTQSFLARPKDHVTFRAAKFSRRRITFPSFPALGPPAW
jgi:hypothetical protein